MAESLVDAKKVGDEEDEDDHVAVEYVKARELKIKYRGSLQIIGEALKIMSQSCGWLF